jgi:hypothetical protein
MMMPHGIDAAVSQSRQRGIGGGLALPRGGGPLKLGRRAGATNSEIVTAMAGVESVA